MSVVLELPAWYVDAVTIDALDSGAGDPYFVVANRFPDPGQVDALLSTDLSFDLMTQVGDSPDSAQINLWLTIGADPEEQAIDAGAFLIANDPGTGITSIDAQTTRVVINFPGADFLPADTLIGVRLFATSTNGQVVSATWSFTTEDLVAPVVVAAQGIARRVVRVTWDEPLTMTADSNGALDPDNYSFERLTVPAVDLVAVGVVEVDDHTVDITTDVDMTSGALYRVTATRVEDLFANAVAPPNDHADFVAYACQAPADRDFDIYTTMIPQIQRDRDVSGDLKKFVSCIQEIADLLLCDIDHWSDIIDPDIAPEIFVDAMLVDLGNPFEFDLLLVDKRRLLRVLVEVYRLKGTAVGIINVVRFFLGLEITIRSPNVDEGWELGIDELGVDSILGPSDSFNRYSFEIVSPILLTDEQRRRITDIAQYMKPAHTHLLGIVEPAAPISIDHWEIGLSELGVESVLH